MKTRRITITVLVLSLLVASLTALTSCGHKHELSKVAESEATCTENGTESYYTCSGCDKLFADAEGSVEIEAPKSIEKLGHTFTSYVSNNDATCIADGTKTAKCDNCDATDTKADEGSKKDHSFTSYVSDNNATCLEDGTKTAKCDNCDATDTKADEGSMKDHSFTNYVSNENATCLEDGTKTAKCDNCDATDTKVDEGSKKGHSFTNYVSNDDATCTADGTATAKCDNCDVTDTKADEGSKKGHSFTNYVSDENATCTEDGTVTAKCDRCEVTHTKDDEGSKKGHSFTNYVSDENATCTADGTKTAKCDRCDVTDTTADEGSKKGHSFTNYVSDGNATCTADGTKTAKCDRCDATDTKADEGSKREHTPAEAVKENIVNATCAKDGSYDLVVKCSNCGTEIGRETVTVNATGEHIYATEQEKVDATCETNGYVIMACGCGATETTTLTAIGHDYDSVVTAPTCTEAGYTTYTCKNNSEHTYTADAVDALGHSYGDWSIVAEPTVDLAGSISKTCATCGDVVTKELPILNVTDYTANTSLVDSALTTVFTYNGTEVEYSTSVTSTKYISVNGQLYSRYDVAKLNDGNVVASFDDATGYTYHAAAEQTLTQISTNGCSLTITGNVVINSSASITFTNGHLNIGTESAVANVKVNSSVDQAILIGSGNYNIIVNAGSALDVQVDDTTWNAIRFSHRNTCVFKVYGTFTTNGGISGNRYHTFTAEEGGSITCAFVNNGQSCTLSVNGSMTVKGKVAQTKNSKVLVGANGSLGVEGNLQVTDGSTGTLTVDGTLNVAGNTTGVATFTVGATGNVTITGTANVTPTVTEGGYAKIGETEYGTPPASSTEQDA